MVEAAFGSLWSEVGLSHTSTTASRVTFREDDLLTLKQETKSHGAVLRDVVIRASYWDGEDWLSSEIYVWPDVGRSGGVVEVDISGPVRVEVEAFALSLARSAAAFRRRKAWKESTIETKAMTVSSDAKYPSKNSRAPRLRATGLKPRLWRWFVRNRDNLIIGLGASFLIALLVIVLQVAGVIPVPD